MLVAIPLCHSQQTPCAMHELEMPVGGGEAEPVLSPSGLLLGYMLKTSPPAVDHASQTPPATAGTRSSPTSRMQIDIPATPAAVSGHNSTLPEQSEQQPQLVASIVALKESHAQARQAAAELQDLIRVLQQQHLPESDGDGAGGRPVDLPHGSHRGPLEKQQQVGQSVDESAAQKVKLGEENLNLAARMHQLAEENLNLAGLVHQLGEENLRLEERCKALGEQHDDHHQSGRDIAPPTECHHEADHGGPVIMRQMTTSLQQSDDASSLGLIMRLEVEMSAIREQLEAERGLTAAAERDKSALKRRVKEAEFASSLLQQQAAAAELERLALKNQLEGSVMELAQERLRLQEDRLRGLSEAATREEVVAGLKEELRVCKEQLVTLGRPAGGGDQSVPLRVDPALTEELREVRGSLERHVIVTKAALERVEDLEQGLQLALEQVRLARSVSSDSDILPSKYSALHILQCKHFHLNC